MVLDADRVTEQINLFWEQHGQTAIVAAALLTFGLTALAVVRFFRSKQRDRWIAGVTALVVLAWTSEGLWEVAYLTLELPLVSSAVTFFVYEAMMLTSAVQAEQHRRRHGTPGPAGRYVWVLATLTATIVALNSSTLVEATLRFTLPLAAAGLWWISITAERDNEPAEVTARRAALAAHRAATWAVTPRTVLVAAGIMRPGVENITDAGARKALRRQRGPRCARRSRRARIATDYQGGGRRCLKRPAAPGVGAGDPPRPGADAGPAGEPATFELVPNPPAGPPEHLLCWPYRGYRAGRIDKPSGCTR